LMILRTSIPAIWPASLVACLFGKKKTSVAYIAMYGQTVTSVGGKTGKRESGLDRGWESPEPAPLRVVEVRGDGDHRFGYRVPEVRGRVVAEFPQNLGADFLSREILPRRFALDLDVAAFAFNGGVRHLPVLVRNLVVTPSDEPLDAEKRVLRVHHALALGDLFAGK
jgi:hypothetical protein